MADVSNEIVTVRVDEQQQILELSRKFTYINGQVLTHVMTTNKVTMEELKTKIQAEIIQMDTQLNAFAECLPEMTRDGMLFRRLRINTPSIKELSRAFWKPVQPTKPRHMYQPLLICLCLTKA